jgi:hypothetical protein
MNNGVCRIESLDRQRVRSKSVWPWENVSTIVTITIDHVRGREFGAVDGRVEIESDLGCIHSRGFNRNGISCNRKVYGVFIDELVIEGVVYENVRCAWAVKGEIRSIT